MASATNEALQRKLNAENGLRDLETEREKAWAARRSVVEQQAAASTTDEQRPALEAEYTRLEASITQLDTRIAAQRRLASMASDEHLQAAQRESAEKESADPERPAYGATTAHDNRTDRPWGEGNRGLGEFALAVRNAHMGNGVDPRLFRAAASGLNEALGPEGGFAVPTEYASGIERDVYETGQILKMVDTRDITGSSIVYNVQRETSRADGSRQGGVLGYWVDEAEAPTPTKPTLARLELKLRKLACLGYSTEELDADAPALGQELKAMFTDEIIFQVENGIYRGTGAGKPLGFLNSPCLVTVSKEAGPQTAATINTTNLSKMWARLPARDRLNSVWLINVDTEPQLDLLSITAGSSALEPRFVTYGPDGVLRIKGRPVIAVEYAATLGTVGDIALVNLKKYRLIRKGGVQHAQSIHVRFAQGENTYRCIYRVDGQPVPRAAVTPFQGTATQSPFIVLETR